MDPRRFRAALATALAAGIAAVGVVSLAGEDEETSTTTGAAEIAATLAAIESGEPLPHEEDGGVFQNREGLLPERPLGYYREYTVETPDSPDRGARRLVIGEGGETYYTDDHYASFTQIDPEDYP